MLRESIPVEEFKGVKAVPPAGHILSQDKYVFPENLDGFSLKDKKVDIYSEESYVTVWCAPPMGNFIASHRYKMNYESEDKKLEISVFIPRNKSEAAECYKVNSDFFSTYKNITYGSIAINGSDAFFIEGKLSSTYIRALFMLDKNSNYIIFTNTTPEENLNKEDIINIASEFKVLKK